METQNIKWIIVGEYTKWNHKILNGSLLESIQIGNTHYVRLFINYSYSL